jgi:uncharacterized RDD family membrane protein YckC
VTARAQEPDWGTLQGNYAGSVSRFLAYAIDAAVSSGLFALGLAAVSYVVSVVTGQSVSWNRGNIAVAAIFVLWQFLYFGYSWAAGGKTFGMAILGIRVVRADGTVIDPWRGVVRALVFPLSFLLFGLGFLGILVGREHRALHDVIAGTAVVYSWDARSARLGFLTRPPGLDHPKGDKTGHA